MPGAAARGRAARRLLRVMLQAVRDHAEQLRKKKEEAFKANIVAAPGLLGKVRAIRVCGFCIRPSSSMFEFAFISSKVIRFADGNHLSRTLPRHAHTHTCSHAHVRSHAHAHTRTQILTRAAHI